MRKYSTYFIVLAALLWSLDTLLRKPLTGHLNSSTIVFFEHAFGVLLLLPVLIKGSRVFQTLSRKDWLALLFIGIGGSALATYFFTLSFSYVSPSVAILLQKVQPLIALGLAAVLLKERLAKTFWLWGLVAILGAYFVSFPKGIDALSVFETRGVYFALLAAVLWGGSTVFGRHLVKKMTFPTLTALRLLTAFIFLSFFITARRELSSLADVSLGDLGSLIAITLFTGTGALLLYYYGLKGTKASVATIAELFFPFSAVVINWIFLNERLDTIQIIGGIVLMGAIYMTQRAGKKDIDQRDHYAASIATQEPSIIK
ncbi:MAG: DMT family transporter [Patescibacteria group bacterium]|jgi:drug/metabolite transporter (DMT)-like permease